MRLNILFATTTLSGTRHATSNMTLEDLVLRAELESKVVLPPMPDHPSQATIGERSTAAVEVTRRLLSRAKASVRALLAEEKKLRRARKIEETFLRSRFLEERLCSFSKSDIADKELWEACSGVLSTAVTMSPMPNLTHHWRFGLNVEQPLEFNYDKRRGVLVSKDPTKLQSALSQYWQDPPPLVIGSFDTQEHSLRLIPTPEGRGPLMEITADYNELSKEPGSKDLVSTPGLVADVAEVLASEPMNLVDLSNVTYRRDAESEHGRLFFRGFFEHGKPQAAAERLVVKRIRSLPNWSIKPTIRRKSAQKVFLSMQEWEPRRKEIKDIVQAHVADAGLEIETVQEPAGLVEEAVINALKSSVMVIQVYSNIDESLSWMCSEYGMARMRGFQPLIFVDTSKSKLYQWKEALKVSSGLLHGINCRGTKRTMEEDIAPTLTKYCEDRRKWVDGSERMDATNTGNT
jgi:hypothetical protein